MKKPALRHLQNKGLPDSVIHSTMDTWVKEKEKPDLICRIECDDGSSTEWPVPPKQQEVFYNCNGEKYSVFVDTNRHYDELCRFYDGVDKPLTKKQYKMAVNWWLGKAGDTTSKVFVN